MKFGSTATYRALAAYSNEKTANEKAAAAAANPAPTPVRAPDASPPPPPPPAAAENVALSAPLNPLKDVISTSLPGTSQKPLPPIHISTEGLNQQYDLARNRAATTEAGNIQGNRDAINRRLAMMGGGPGGVGLKLDQQAQDASGQRLIQANEGINAAQAADLNKVSQLETQLNAQQQAQEADRALSERGQNLSSALSARGQGIDLLKTNLQNTQFGQQLQHEITVDDFNMKLARDMADKKDVLENLLGNFSMGNLLSSSSNLGGAVGFLGGGGALTGGFAGSLLGKAGVSPSSFGF